MKAKIENTSEEEKSNQNWIVKLDIKYKVVIYCEAILFVFPETKEAYIYLGRPSYKLKAHYEEGFDFLLCF